MVEIPALQRMPRLVSIKSASAATCTIHFRIPSTKFDYIQTVSAKKCIFTKQFILPYRALLAQQLGLSLWGLDNIISCWARRCQSYSLHIYHFYFCLVFIVFPHDFYGRQHCRFHGSCFCSPDRIKTLSTRCVSQQLYSFLYFSCPSYRHYQKEIWHSKYSE